MYLIGGFIALLVILLIIGVPIYLAFLASSIFYVALSPDLSIVTTAHVAFVGIDKWALLAIPFFILAGNLLAYGGPGKYLVGFLDSLMGHLPGGMSAVAILACMFFAALSGSGPATTVAIGAVMVAPMVARGYDKKYTMGAITTAGSLGNVIPPSIGFIVLASLTEQDAGVLFMAGLIPGIIIGLCLVAVAVPVAIRTGYGVKKAATWGERGRAFVNAIPALVMPVIILGGIYGGIFTPTEAAAVACVYSLIACAIYRELDLTNLRRALWETTRATGTLLIMIAAALVFAMVLTYLKIPQAVTELVIEANLSPLGFLFATWILCFILGCFLDAAPIIFITLPILWAPAMALGISEVHMAVMLLIFIIGGQATPPVGINLFAMASLTKERLDEIAVGAIPFFTVEFLAMIPIILVPSLSTWLPKIMH